MSIPEFKIGWAFTNITPDRPVYLAGQLYNRISQYVRDPITATVLALKSDTDQAVFISADMVSVPVHVLQRVRAELSDLQDLDVQKISFSVTHTHNSSLFGPEKRLLTNQKYLSADILPLEETPDDLFTGEEAADFLTGKLVEMIRRAWTTMRPGGISCAQDYAAIAFNRRPVFKTENGLQTVMYGDCSQDHFVSFEGTSDHSADMIYTWDTSGHLTGVVIVIPCPAQVFELHQMITADYWSSVRAKVKEKLGNVPVLPLCGAAGDQNPLDLVRMSKHNKKTLPLWSAQAGEVQRNLDMGEECDRIGERIAEAVIRGEKSARCHVDPNPPFFHDVVSMSLPLRKVTPSEAKAAKDILEEVHATHSTENRLTESEVVRLFETIGIVERWDLQKQKEFFCFDSHVMRLGQVALATNPFELFCEYGLRLKARSKASQTIVIQLTDENGGYLPTAAALAGGSYSSKPASTLCGPEGGDLLVEKTLSAMNRFWR